MPKNAWVALEFWLVFSISVQKIFLEKLKCVLSIKAALESIPSFVSMERLGRASYCAFVYSPYNIFHYLEKKQNNLNACSILTLSLAPS